MEVCIVDGFRLMEYHVFNDNDLVQTYFNITDELGVPYGYAYDNVETPFRILLNI